MFFFCSNFLDKTGCTVYHSAVEGRKQLYAGPAAYPGGWAARTEATASSLKSEMYAMWLIPLRIMLEMKMTRSALVLRIRVVFKL